MGRLEEISKILTLSYSKYRIITFLIVLLLLTLLPISFFEGLPSLSICAKILGKYCYSIGITRGISCLLKGDIYQALNYNLLAPYVLMVIIFIIFYDLSFILRRGK